MMNSRTERRRDAGPAARDDAGPVHRRRTQRRRQGPPQVRGKLCLCFPDAYTLGMSHHGLQVLYTIMNADPQWACERAFTPWLDFEAELRGTACRSTAWRRSRRCSEFDVLGFSLQYEVCYTNVLTMLDLGGVPHFAARTARSTDPLVIAGGPGAQNPELLAPFVDLFVIGDGEESLPWVMDKWMDLKEQAVRDGDFSHRRRLDMLAEVVGVDHVGLRPGVLRAGVPRRRHHRRREPHAGRRAARGHGLHHHPGLRRHPAADQAGRAVRADAARPHRHRDHARLPVAVPVLPDRPSSSGRCGSARVETIVQAALESYRNTGTNEISLLSAVAAATTRTSRSWSSGCTRCSPRWA